MVPKSIGNGPANFRDVDKQVWVRPKTVLMRPTESYVTDNLVGGMPFSIGILPSDTKKTVN